MDDHWTQVTDESVRGRAVEHARAAGVRLPTFAELADPSSIPAAAIDALAGVDPDAPDPRNLYRVHWHNAGDRRATVEVPDHLVLPPELTGVEAKIILALGNRFPMVGAHKVLPAYACLVPRLVTGNFDPTGQRAVWPSTGNYCRGGVAISRILGCRAVAVLPEGMSRERFEWLEAWTSDPADIVRTPGSESNVKEIYDACAALARDPDNVILNQFSEFGNYVVHRAVTGPALARVFEAVRGEGPLRARAFVAASGSAGTLAAGDHLRDVLGTRTCVVEASECPTLLRNGYGEHNIQGIGDKHLPLIHNVMATDFVAGVSDSATDALDVLFNTEAGRAHLAARKGVPDAVVSRLGDLGLSSIANVVASVKLARHLGLGPHDAIITVATDGAALYPSERAMTLRDRFGGTLDAVDAAEIFGRHMLGAAADDLLELDTRERERIFNLGYYTWVEQQGVALADFDARRDPGWWDGLMDRVAAWDAQIESFNAEL